MKNFLLSLLLLPALVFGAANDMVVNQRNPTDTGQLTKLLVVPTTGTTGIWGYNVTTNTPTFYTPGAGLTLTGTVLDTSPITSGQITTALGFTPYNATNPSGYVTQAGARSAISLTTTGTSGAATYNNGTGVLNVPIYAAPSPVFNNSPGRSIVTSTSSTGFQISASRIADVCYEGTFQTTSTIGGPAAITVFLETADTNSTTPGDWTIRARQTNSNTITLAVVLNQVDIEPWSICRKIEAGKYVRIRSGSVTGTATAAINTEQQEYLP